MKRLKFKGLSGTTPDELAERLERFVEEETAANYGSFQLVDVKYQKGVSHRSSRNHNLRSMT